MKDKKQGRRSAIDAQQTKKQILLVAMKLFCEQGYQGVSLRNISELAGVSHSLIRYHFGNKEQIWYAVSDTLHEYMQAYVLKLIEQLDSKMAANCRLYVFSVRLLAHMLLVPKPIQFAADMARQEHKFLDYFVDSLGKIELSFGNLVDSFNLQHPDKSTSLWEQKWMIITNAHAAHSLKPLMIEGWKDETTDHSQCLLNHWKLFNRQLALFLCVQEADMIHTEDLGSLLIEMKACFLDDCE
jgi:AcrR family transcriptional regulator